MLARPNPGALFAAVVIIAATSATAQHAPPPAPTGLSPETLALACAPALAYEPPPKPLRVTGGQSPFARWAYSASDLVTINAGTKNGIEVGQEYFVKRTLVSRGAPITRNTPATIQTTGWIRVYAVDDELSLATVTHSCDSIDVGDYLEPLVLPSMPTPSTDRGKPERGNYGRVMSGMDVRGSFGKGDFFILNRGTDFGITPGAQFVLYRDKKQDENFLYELGEAIAVNVNGDWSTLMVTLSRDAIQAGDYAGMRTRNLK
jgi:hypothetical protein